MKQKTIEEQIEQYQKETGIVLDPHNKKTLHDMIEREDKEAANEEREHSHSPVGDRNNMREVQD